MNVPTLHLDWSSESGGEVVKIAATFQVVMKLLWPR